MKSQTVSVLVVRGGVKRKKFGDLDNNQNETDQQNPKGSKSIKNMV